MTQNEYRYGATNRRREEIMSAAREATLKAEAAGECPYRTHSRGRLEEIASAMREGKQKALAAPAMTERQDPAAASAGHREEIMSAPAPEGKSLRPETKTGAASTRHWEEIMSSMRNSTKSAQGASWEDIAAIVNAEAGLTTPSLGNVPDLRFSESRYASKVAPCIRAEAAAHWQQIADKINAEALSSSPLFLTPI